MSKVMPLSPGTFHASGSPLNSGFRSHLTPSLHTPMIELKQDPENPKYWNLETDNQTLISYLDGTTETNLPKWEQLGAGEFRLKIPSTEQARRMLFRILIRMDDEEFRISYQEDCFFVVRPDVWTKPTVTKEELVGSGYDD